MPAPPPWIGALANETAQHSQRLSPARRAAGSVGKPKLHAHAQALSRVDSGSTNHSAVRAESFDAESREARRAAIAAVARREPAGVNQHAGALCERLEDSDYSVRLAAVRALGKLEPFDLAFVARAVAGRLEDQNKEVRVAAVAALGRLTPRDLEPYSREVAGRLEDHANGPARLGAVRALGRLSRGALRPHSGDLEKRLEDPRVDVRHSTIRTHERAHGRPLSRHSASWHPDGHPISRMERPIAPFDSTKIVEHAELRK